MSPLYRWTLKWARFVHLYLTLFGLGLLLFFSVTGFLLNHEAWFLAEPVIRDVQGQLPAHLVEAEEVDKLAVAEYLRREQAATGLVESFEADPDHLRVVFKRPGQEIIFEISRPSGEFEAHYQYQGVMSVLLDLHRGKSSGLVWSLVIDIVAVLMLVIAGTGLVLWWSLKGRGHYGLATLLGGIVLSFLLYYLFIP